MLCVNNLVVQRGGKSVLHGVSLQVAPGQITALVGANGAGKSSLVMALAGALPLVSGGIELDGAALSGRRPEAVRAAGVAVVPEGHRVLGDLSVRDNLRAAATAWPARQVQAEVDRVLAVMPELSEKMDALGRSLSGGQKQMVCVAQALIARPRYLVLDELSLGLAPTVVKRLVALVQQVAAQGVGVLLIEQFTSVALAVSQNAYVLERGRVAFGGLAQTLREQPDILHSSYLAA
ncbi:MULTISPECIES: ABC transporter ATP-binding protein [unclassified Acidovorax]|uniref:ABC transporter ATP-binding protein n=1 Tax=unclassified Acidovorax TaxID=2684926 RepID=UPI001C43F381|nr:MULTISPECIES: ATP-binding cassette domain-containing protein [unclassified Acidovorax]MBV7428379.1 ATP-binding cassette domain-containing protein [Acidovorax sp. sif0732]MBV7449635.1 ATP-binding cassette domain-containing protein [Acidovorax sp. sif0715]